MAPNEIVDTIRDSSKPQREYYWQNLAQFYQLEIIQKLEEKVVKLKILAGIQFQQTNKNVITCHI